MVCSSAIESTLNQRYQVVHGWPRLPEGEILGAVTGVALDSSENVWVFHRAGRTWPVSGVLDLSPIELPCITLLSSQTGELIRCWGEKLFAMPHGLTVDKDGNLWLTDVAYHQVYKYSPQGELLLTLGERGIAGDDTGYFNYPTEVAVAADGGFYVTDGYGNARVIKFSARGEFQYQWGTKGSAPGEFDLPHGIALDAWGNVYVADRTNARVQIFDAQGAYLNEWKSAELGRPYTLSVCADGSAFVVDGGDQPQAPPDRSAVVWVNARGDVLQRIGRYGNYDGQFRMAHDVACAADGALYIGDVNGARVQKFVLSPC